MKRILLAIKPYLLLLWFAILGYTSVAQTGEIKGVVIDSESGESIIAATVWVRELGRGARTDFDGFYALPEMEPGNYTLTVTYVGYDSALVQIQLKPGESKQQNFYLVPAFKTLEAAEVTGKRIDKTKVTSVSKNTIKPEDIKTLPSIGAPDLAQYLQVLPGVIFTGDQGGQLYIRGGSPVMNRVMIDGMTLYNPFHSIGLFSVFDSDLIRNADVYSAGFGAEYGGRISAIIDIKTRDGNKKRHGGVVNSGTFLSKILLEGPLSKFEPGKSASSYAISIKNSYLEQAAPTIYPFIDPDILPYRFNDIYAKLAFVSPDGNSFRAFGFRFDDQVNFPQSTRYNWVSNGFGGRFAFVPTNSRTKIDGFIAFSDYTIEQEEVDLRPRKSAINGFNMGINFNYFLKKDEIRYGLEVNQFSTDFEIFNANNRRISQKDNTTEIAGYFLYRHVRRRWLFDAGIRGQMYASLGNVYIEPRFSTKYNITRNFRFKAATGLYSQNLLSAFSDRDVVNLFYGFLSGPDNLPSEFDGNPINHRLQTAWHGVAGFEIDLSKKFEVNVEGFYKGFLQLSNINRNKLFEDVPTNQDKPENLRQDFIIENGDAYGADITLKYTERKFFIWAVYSLTYVNRFDGEISYPTHWDRRHNINTIVSYTPDKKRTWNLSVRWNLGSGFPFTQSLGYYERLDFQQNGIGTNPLIENGNLGVSFAELNGGRLPYYHRLDASVEKTLFKTKNSEAWILFSVTNIYNRNNIFYFDRVAFDRVDQLPLMPSLSLNLKF